jgi:hypothetical protein
MLRTPVLKSIEMEHIRGMFLELSQIYDDIKGFRASFNLQNINQKNLHETYHGERKNYALDLNWFPPEDFYENSAVIDVYHGSNCHLNACSFWNHIAQKRLRVSYMLGFIVYYTSRHATMIPSYSESDIYSKLDEHSALCNAHFVEQHESHSSGRRDTFTKQISFKKSDMSFVSDFVHMSLDYLVDLILCGWDCILQQMHKVKATDPVEYTSTVVHGFPHHIVMPKLYDILETVFNGYYNRSVSLIGRFLELDNFKTVKGQQGKLNLLHFVIVNGSQQTLLYSGIFSLLGVTLTPSPRLSLALDINKLVSQFNMCLQQEIELYTHRAVSNCYSNRSDEGSKNKSSSEDNLWDMSVVNGAFIGPIPETVFGVLVTYMHMAVVPDVKMDFESKALVSKMNMHISQSVLNSYLTVSDALERSLKLIFQSLNESKSLEESSVDSSSIQIDITDKIQLLSSIANDCHRIVSVHIPLLVSYVVEPDDSLKAVLQQVQDSLAYVSWTAVEILVKSIFIELEDIFVKDMSTILTIPISESSEILDNFLSRIEGYLSDLKNYLYEEGYTKLLMSCCNKIIHRYFLLLYDYARNIERVFDSNKLVQFPLMHLVLEESTYQSVVNAIESRELLHPILHKLIPDLSGSNTSTLLAVRSLNGEILSVLDYHITQLTTFCVKQLGGDDVTFSNSLFPLLFQQINVTIITIYIYMYLYILCNTISPFFIL